jgi:Pyruvate/2-oxoacid:ferredoxin oxidoreductase delta subunit
MKRKRKIIEIDESKCTGCGACVLSCAEGALQIVDGKAKLVGEVFCDGLGACIGDCPEDALRIVERDADGFDEAEVEKARTSPAAPGTTSEKHEPALPCGCPSAAAMTFDRPKPGAAAPREGESPSELTHFPIKLQLLNPAAPFLKHSDLLLLADCSAAAYPDLHPKFLRDHTVALACPKLDDIDMLTAKLEAILRESNLNSLTIVHMEVPCCSGLLRAAEKAIESAGVKLPVERIIISRDGKIISKTNLDV